MLALGTLSGPYLHWGLSLSGPLPPLGTLPSTLPLSTVGDSSLVLALGTLFLFPLSTVGDSSLVLALGTLFLFSP